MRLLRMRQVLSVRKIAAAFAVVAILCLILDLVVFPLPNERLRKPHSHFVYDRDGQLLNCFASPDKFWRKPVELGDISPLLIETVTACEDRWFNWHPGVNLVSLTSAAFDNLRQGRVVRGGSTITMQVARMMEPKARTIPNKLIEIARAVQLEMHYSKDELLEMYFNLVPYGGNIEGVGAATYFYFGKTPENLTLSECAILAAIPVSPNKYRPDLHQDSCRERRDRILTALRAKEDITEDEYIGGIEEEMPTCRLDRPFFAPHFCQDMVEELPGESEIHSTLDFGLQVTCERLGYRHHLTLADKGIHNLSVVVLDNRTGELLSMIGSPVFSDIDHEGQVNGATSVRSPGSALKPFVYALAFEKGLLTPSTAVEDIPINYDGYAPDNYDDEYRGAVPVSDALIWSLNIPAVNTAASVGLDNYYELLQKAGLLGGQKPYHYYGLPLVLGACEVSLVDLSNAYASLARGGVHQPVITSIQQGCPEGRRVLSEEAAYLVSDILAELNRPELNSSWEFTPDLPTIAWKTGTSYGRKDAWAVGYNPDYTVGVWAGNFSAESSPYIVGVDIAAPLMLDVFREITKGDDQKWFDIPVDVDVREVCAVSGAPAGQWCSETQPGLHIRDVSQITPCQVHQRILVNHDSGLRLSRACVGDSRVDTLIVQSWSPRLSNWMVGRGIIPPIPPKDPKCNSQFAAEAPVITSPEQDVVYQLRNDAPSIYQQVMFQASVASGSRKLHWFLDSELFATCDVGERVFYEPEVGTHRLMCVDEQGRSSTVEFEVR